MILALLECISAWSARSLSRSVDQENLHLSNSKTDVVGLTLMRISRFPRIFQWLMQSTFSKDVDLMQRGASVFSNLLTSRPNQKPTPQEYADAIISLASAVEDAYDMTVRDIKSADLASNAPQVEEMVSRLDSMVKLAGLLCERQMQELLCAYKNSLTLDIRLIKLLLTAIENAFSCDSVEAALEFIEIAPEIFTCIDQDKKLASPLLQSETLLGKVEI